jgi:hypothetical protein
VVCRVRYEISTINQSSGAAEASTEPHFRFARCKRALTNELHQAAGIPLPVEHLEVLLEGLTWEAFAVRLV